MKFPLIQKLTNRQGSEKSLFHDFDPDFSQQSMSRAWTDVQRRLLLHVEETKTPTFIAKCVSILTAFPDLLQFLGEKTQKFQVLDKLISDNNNFLFRLSRNGSSPTGFRAVCSHFPVGTNYSLEFLPNNTLMVSNEYEKYSIQNVQYVQHGSIIRITCDWPTKFPIESDILLHKAEDSNVLIFDCLFPSRLLSQVDYLIDGENVGSVNTIEEFYDGLDPSTTQLTGGQSLPISTLIVGQVFNFKYEPQALDYAAWLNHLTATTSYEVLLKDSGLLTSYYLTFSNIEKIAYIIASLVKTYDKHVVEIPTPFTKEIQYTSTELEIPGYAKLTGRTSSGVVDIYAGASPIYVKI